MDITTYSLMVIIGSGLVTWLPRVIPFLLVRKIAIPDIVLRFLSYVPICILTALFVQNLLIHRENQWPQINFEYVLATIPTVITAVVTKNLMWIVVIGMLSMALIRFLM